IDDTTIRRADPIFITSKETVCANESDIFRAARDGVISWDRVSEISSLLLGKAPGRANDRQITLYKLQGIGLMDVAVGMHAYERLKDRKLDKSFCRVYRGRGKIHGPLRYVGDRFRPRGPEGCHSGSEGRKKGRDYRAQKSRRRNLHQHRYNPKQIIA